MRPNSTPTPSSRQSEKKMKPPSATQDLIITSLANDCWDRLGLLEERRARTTPDRSQLNIYATFCYQSGLFTYFEGSRSRLCWYFNLGCGIYWLWRVFFCIVLTGGCEGGFHRVEIIKSEKVEPFATVRFVMREKLCSQRLSKANTFWHVPISLEKQFIMCALAANKFQPTHTLPPKSTPSTILLS